MNLQEQIENFKEDFNKMIPEKTAKIMAKATKTLIQSGIADHALKTGDMTPSFSLSNAYGDPISLADMLKRGNVLLKFYRGAWCPFCNLELKALQEVLPELIDRDINLLAISPNLPNFSMSTIAKNSLSFEVLSDPGNAVARQFGLVYRVPEKLHDIYDDQLEIDITKYNGDNSYELPVPATYVIDPEGTIIFSFVNADYTKRLEPSELVEILKEILEKVYA